MIAAVDDAELKLAGEILDGRVLGEPALPGVAARPLALADAEPQSKHSNGAQLENKEEQEQPEGLQLLIILKGSPDFKPPEADKMSVWDELKKNKKVLPPATYMNKLLIPPADSTAMDVIIIIAILLNTLILAVQHPNNDYGDAINQVFKIADLVFTSIFTIEMFIKIGAYGFYKGNAQGKVSYISDGWNRLDFVVVIVSWFSILIEALHIQLPIKVSTLRALRILRVLKSLKFLKGVGTILTTLSKAAAAMTTILAFLGFVFTIAGIVGIQLFRGTLNWRCSKLAPEPDASGLDWIPLGVGDITYRKHCQPKWEKPKCPEFPPCNRIFHKHTKAPVLDATDNQLRTGSFVSVESFNPARQDRWLVRVPDTQFNASAGHVSEVFDDSGRTTWAAAPNMSVPVVGGGTVVRSAYLDFESYDPWEPGKENLAANQSRGLRCPPCYDANVCSADESCYEYGNPGFGWHGFNNIGYSWLTIFIEMANLYWWETGYRTQDADIGLPSVISYDFSFLIVLVLSMVSVNMFVAVITDEFGMVRAEEGLSPFVKKKANVQLLVSASKPLGISSKYKPDNVEIKCNGKTTIGQLKQIFQIKYLNDELEPKHIQIWKLGENDIDGVATSPTSTGRSSPSASKSGYELEDDERVCVFLQAQEDARPTAEKTGGDEDKCQVHCYCFKNGDRQEWLDTVLDRERIEDGVDEDGVAQYFTPQPTPPDPSDPRAPTLPRKPGHGNDTKESVQGLRQLVLHAPPPCYQVRCFANLITKEGFDNFIMTFILFNTVTLSAEHFDQPDEFTFALENIGHVFNLVFTVELILKVFGMGMYNYIRVPFNRLDCFIVVTSLLNYLGDILPGGRIWSAFRLFRVARVLRLLLKYESMRKVLKTVMGSGVALANLTIFILFTVSIFAAFGMHLFGGTYPKGLAVPRRNFENIGRAWLMAFQTLTGDDWCNQMYQYMNVAGPLLPVMVFGMCFICCNYILTNLFIAVILENFEMAEEVKKMKQEVKDLELEVREVEARIADKEEEETNPEVARLRNRSKSKSAAVVAADDDNAEFDLMFPMQDIDTGTVKENKCANLCRDPVLWFCRGCPVRDCRKKTRRQKRQAEGNPEDLTKKCCHGPNNYCAISKENNVSCFLFHGRTETFEMCEVDGFGDEITAYEWYYTHPVRRVFQAIERNPWFERTVMAAIVISSVLLAYEGPADSLEGLILYDDKLITDALASLDTCFYTIFMFEFFTKVIHRGFIFTPEAYLGDSWNRLDFLVVFFSTMNYVPGQEKSSLGRVFRLGRCLRPLRMVNKNPGLKVIVSAVIESLGTNLGVMAMSGMLFLIFGILGCNLFGGKFWHCTCPDSVGNTHPHFVWRTNCNACMASNNITGLSRGEDFQKDGPGHGSVCADLCDDEWTQTHDLVPDIVFPGENDRLLCEAAVYYDDHRDVWTNCKWQNKRYNFDSISDAFNSMFTASTLAGWTDIMEISIDSVGIEQQPQEMASPLAAVYWVLFVFLNAFFITNLFVGVLVDYIAQFDGSALQTEEQQKWTDLKRFIAELQPDIDPPVPPKDPIRRYSLLVVTSPRWELTSSTCIVVNVIVMCCEFQYQPVWYEDGMEAINNGFLIFFTVEMVLKLIGMGLSRYWLDLWNRFDAIVVLASWGGMVLDISVQVVRAFRAFRIVLVLKNAKKLQALFKCLIWAIVPSMNIGALMILHYSLFAILGMQVLGKNSGPHFDEVPEIFPGQYGGDLGTHKAYLLSELKQTQQTVQTNFKSFFGAMKLLFECSSGKDWKIVMYEVGDVAGNAFAFYFFFFHFFISVYILSNLFVAVIIDTFASSKRELPVNTDNMVVFQAVWKAHCMREREKLAELGLRSSKLSQSMDGFILMSSYTEEHTAERISERERQLAHRRKGGTDSRSEDEYAFCHSLVCARAVCDNPSDSVRGVHRRDLLTNDWDRWASSFDIRRPEEIKALKERYREKKKWSNVVKLLKDVGRFKVSAEDLERQRALTAEVNRMNEHIYDGNVHEAQKILRSLQDKVVKLWKWLSRDGDHNPVSGPIVEGMGPEIKTGNKSAEEVMESWTSGTLCAHPTWDDDQLRRNEVLWDDWWCVLCCQCKGRPFFTAHVAKSYGRDKFIVELNTRRKAPKNLYVDKKRPWYHSWCPGCHPHKDPDENLVGMKGYIKPTHQNMVAYNAVLEALVLTACGDDAKDADEIRLEKQEKFDQEMDDASVVELHERIAQLKDAINAKTREVEERQGD